MGGDGSRWRKKAQFGKLRYSLGGVPHAWLLVPAVLLFFFLALNSMVGDSPTIDEESHLAFGLAFLHSGDPRLSLEHPPFVNLLSALMVSSLPGIRVPFDHPSWNEREGWYTFANQLLWVYNQDVTRMIFLARAPIVFLTIGLALVGYHFARLLWGRAAACLAFLLLLFDPNVLAHGRYSTTDVGGTTFLFLAALLIWRLWQTPAWSWPRLGAAGLGIGLALASKLYSVGVLPFFALMATVPPLYGFAWRWQVSVDRLARLALACALGLFVLWATYGFQWGPFQFQWATWALPLNNYSGPMPTFWAGIEQTIDFGRGAWPSYLLGEYSDKGFRAYFPVAFLVKTPLPTLLLLPVAAVLLLKRKQTRTQAAFLLFIPALYFLTAMLSRFNAGYRHLMPMLPFVYVLISGLASMRGKEGAGMFPGRRIVPLLPALAVAGLVIADGLIHPHYLSYFNAVAGGPRNGHRILIESNIDWGQDMLRLKQWLDENHVQQVKLGWYGNADPTYYGIAHDPLPGFPWYYHLWQQPPFDPAAPPPGIYAISVTVLWEITSADKEVYAWFRAREPDARVGYSIFIYNVAGTTVR